VHKLSVVLLSFNQEDFIVASLQSLFKQDLDDLEIIISDDASTDRTYQLIGELVAAYPGPKVVRHFQNARNLGIIGNFNLALGRASGDLIFIAGGDDVALPQRCSLSYRFWLERGACHDLVAADGYDMSRQGDVLGVKCTDALEAWSLRRWHSESRPYFFGASHMVTRRLCELNRLDTRLPFEDQVYVHRALMMGGAIRLPQPLVYHRRGGVSQPERHHQETNKKRRLLQGAQSNLIELEQFLSDAKLLGRQPEVLGLTRQKLAVESYTQEILTQEFVKKKLQLFFRTKGVPFAKRFRFLKYALLYRI